MFDKISDEEQEKAIQFLMDNIPETCLKKVWIEVQNKEYFLSLSLNLYFGICIRNTLRKGGFNWGSLALDALWGTLIEEAARRIHEDKKGL